MPRQRILCITTGGSIDKTYSSEASDFVVGNPVVKTFLRACKCTHTVSFKEVARKDSLHMTDEDREKIVETVRAASETLVVITHGTDTMWKTALSVKQTAVDLGKVVVLTGAMRPAAFKDTDAGFNLGAAFAVVQYLPTGAHVVMNGVVFSEPERLTKDYKQDVFVEKDDNGHDSAGPNKKSNRPRRQDDNDRARGGDDDQEASTVEADPAPAPGGPVYRGRGRGRSRGRGRGRGRADYSHRSRRRVEAPTTDEAQDAPADS